MQQEKKNTHTKKRRQQFNNSHNLISFMQPNPMPQQALRRLKIWHTPSHVHSFETHLFIFFFVCCFLKKKEKKSEKHKKEKKKNKTKKHILVCIILTPPVSNIEIKNSMAAAANRIAKAMLTLRLSLPIILTAIVIIVAAKSIQ